MLNQLALFPAPKPKAPRSKVKSFAMRKPVAEFLLCGGGLQSLTLVKLIADGTLPRPTAAIYADTGDEPAHVYQQIGWARDRLARVGVPLILAHAYCGVSIMRQAEWGSGAHYRTRASMPFWLKTENGTGRLMRQCTSDFKIAVNDTAMKLWLWERGYAKNIGDKTLDPRRDQYDPREESPFLRVNRDVYIAMWLGFTTDESARADDRRGQTWQKAAHPLLDMGMSRADCARLFLADEGWLPRKSACVQCPFHDDAAWLTMRAQSPQEFERACAFDDLVRTPEFKANSPVYRSVRGEMYLHRSLTPLREVDFTARIAARTARGLKPSASLFELELVDAACGNDGGFSCHT